MGRLVTVVGLGFGDEGKGATVDALARTAVEINPNVLIDVFRASGGPQCSHAVNYDVAQWNMAGNRLKIKQKTDESRVINVKYHQVGSAYMRGANTWLCGNMLVDPIFLNIELSRLESTRRQFQKEDALLNFVTDVRIQDNLPVITTYHAAYNQLMHSATSLSNTCGFGLGICKDQYLKGLYITIADLVGHQHSCISKLKLIRASLLDRVCNSNVSGKHKRLFYDHMHSNSGRPEVVLENLRFVFERPEVSIVDETNVLAAINRIVASDNRVGIFEGNQGVLLDQYLGLDSEKYRTYTDTTARSAESFLPSASLEKFHYVLGVTRTYTTRHGDGEMNCTPVPGLSDPSNQENKYQGLMRFGAFNLSLFRLGAKLTSNNQSRALRSGGDLDGISVTCVDQMPDSYDDSNAEYGDMGIDGPEALTANIKRNSKPFPKADVPAYWRHKLGDMPCLEKAASFEKVILPERLAMIGYGPLDTDRVIVQPDLLIALNYRK